MRTRQTPKRAAELIDGGSLYRVYRGQILSRQRILAVETVGQAARSPLRGHPVGRGRPHLADAAAGLSGVALPAGVGRPAGSGASAVGEEAMPEELARRLRELGAW